MPGRIWDGKAGVRRSCSGIGGLECAEFILRRIGYKNGVVPSVENKLTPSRGRRSPGLKRLLEIRQTAGSPTCDHRHPHVRGDRSDQIKIVTLPGPIAVNRLDEDLTSSEFRHPLGKGHRIQAGISAA
jgi:hypothetical protein